VIKRLVFEKGLHYLFSFSCGISVFVSLDISQKEVWPTLYRLWREKAPAVRWFDQQGGFRDQENTIIFKIGDKKRGLKNSPKRNNVKPQYVKTGNEDIND